MAATVMATATAANPAKAVPMVRVATHPVARVVAHAVKDVATDATAVADAADVVVVQTARVEPNVSGLTQTASPQCRWTPTYSKTAKARQLRTAIARRRVLTVHPANGVNAAAAVDVAVASATKPVNVTSSPGQKAVLTP
jgi:hypothetical protein